MTRIAFLLIALIFSALARGEPDYAREKRWADEVLPGVVVGDPVYLAAFGRKFLALYTPRSGSAAGVVIVHGMGLHPDWGLINSLRTGLADAGYTTLSVQMPVLAADADAARYPALFPEAAARLKAAAVFLRDNGNRKVALVSHSLGARMANHFLNDASAPTIDAWVAIGLSGEFSGPERLRMPILDLFGETDFPAVLQNAERRGTALRARRRAAQVEVAGADHFFNGREAELVGHVRRFLDRILR